MKLFFLLFVPTTKKSPLVGSSGIYLLVHKEYKNYEWLTLFLCALGQLWAVTLMAESHVPVFLQGQTEQWCYSCRFGSQMRSKCPAEEEKKPFSCRCLYKMILSLDNGYLYANKGNVEGISFSFQVQGGRWKTKHELHI